MRSADRPEKESRGPWTCSDCTRPVGLPRYRKWQAAELVVVAVAGLALEFAAAVVRWECNRCRSAPASTLSPDDGRESDGGRGDLDRKHPRDLSAKSWGWWSPCRDNRAAGVASNRPAAIRRSRRCTRSSVSWGEGTADPPRLRLATVMAPTALGPPAVAVAAAADRPGDCSGARIACRSW